jgi:hypothetical protein
MVEYMRENGIQIRDTVMDLKDLVMAILIKASISMVKLMVLER